MLAHFQTQRLSLILQKESKQVRVVGQLLFLDELHLLLALRRRRDAFLV